MSLAFSPSSRPPTPNDAERIERAIVQALRSVSKESLGSLASPEKMLYSILSGEARSVVVEESYLVVYDYGIPWYSNKMFLFELMVLKIGTEGSFSDVTDILDHLADQVDAKAIAVGSQLCKAPAALSRLYSRAGFVNEGKTSLVKWR
ncbi:acetyltransferase [Xanthomonas phage SB3]|uniref:Acetyltransferase n=1 Tax=Xanthomonas phage SB3 TaxID=3117472 RepID=A0ABZ2GUK8_9CAUD